MTIPSAVLAASWKLFARDSQLAGDGLVVSAKDMEGCVANAAKFIKKPVTKGAAIEKAVDHCAMDKHVDDKNFVCPHYRDLLNGAFRREPTTREFTAETFCHVAETFAYQMTYAAKIPNMGKGTGFEFKVAKNCMSIVTSSITPKKKLPSASVPDFWYALCMNQDCAHFLPSRTRWCHDSHSPTHSASVCEAVRSFAQDEVSVVGPGELEPKKVCDIYEEFVEDTHINVEAYMHIVHGKKAHMVPAPDEKARALQSAQMKHEASEHEIRDAAGQPVKSAAVPRAAIGALLSLVAFFL